MEQKIWEKHRVRPGEAEEILRPGVHIRIVERGFRQDEDLYAGLGQTETGRHLIVYFIYKPQSREALVVTARGYDAEGAAAVCESKMRNDDGKNQFISGAQP